MSAHSLNLILADGLELPLPDTSLTALPKFRKRLLHVLFHFYPKYSSCHRREVAYFCHSCIGSSASNPTARSIPSFVFHLWQRGLLSNPDRLLFDSIFFSSSSLGPYRGHLAGKSGFPPKTSFKPHSLQIGGPPFCTIHDISPDLRDCLARRAVPGCSLRYYRSFPCAYPRALLHSINPFLHL